jgi:heme exporter protein D
VTPELGRYAATVLAAYGVTVTLLAGLVAASLWRSARVRRRLAVLESRRADHGR